MSKDRKKLLILMMGHGVAGVERTATDLAREFKARGWAAQLVFAEPVDDEPTRLAVPGRTAAEERGVLLEWARNQGVEAETNRTLHGAYATLSWQDVLDLRRFIAARRPDIVNIQCGSNHVALKDVIAVRLAGLSRLVVSIHHPDPWGEDVRRRINTGRASRLCQAMIAPSRATRDLLLEANVPARKIHIIPSGVPVPTPERLPERAEARARLGLPPDAFVISSIARLVPHKSIDRLIEAAARVPDPRGELAVVVAGDGPERADLEDLAAARLGPRAIFLGRVPDETIPDVYAASDLFCLPSKLEGFGLVYIEAAYRRVPSIGTCVGGIPDVIVDGETGLLVPVGDVAAIAAAITRLRDDPTLRAHLGEAARARAYAEFTVERMTDRYVKVLAP